MLLPIYTVAVLVCGGASALLATQGDVGFFVPAGMAAVFAIMLVLEVRQRRLLAEGIETDATVLAVTRSRGAMRIEFEYSTPDGKRRGVTGISTGSADKVFGARLASGVRSVAVYDSRRPDHACFWGLAEPQVAAPPRSSRRLTALGLLLLGGFGVPTAAKVLGTISPQRVLSCQVSHTHRYYANITVEKETLSLTSDDMTTPQLCIPVGSTIEKRRWELGVRVDGRYLAPSSASWSVTPLALLVGFVLVAVGEVKHRRGRPGGL